jgi:hypothetical protein
MKPVTFAFAVLTSLLIPEAAAAQHVTADISVHSGPVHGRVIVGHPDYYAGRRVVVVGPRYHVRHGYRRIAIHYGHRGHGWYRRHGYRPIHVWYDSRHDCYYDRNDRHGRLRAAVIYERGGRYYRDRWSDDDRWERDRDRDGYGRRDRAHRDYDREEYARSD